MAKKESVPPLTRSCGQPSEVLRGAQHSASLSWGHSGAGEGSASAVHFPRGGRGGRNCHGWSNRRPTAFVCRTWGSCGLTVGVGLGAH